MRLRAIVRNLPGYAVHLRGESQAGELQIVPLSSPRAVEVVEQDGGIYLLRLDEQGECLADTWHESVSAAKRQANFEFGIEEADWTDLEPR